MKHILRSQQFSRADLKKLFEATDKLAADYNNPANRAKIRRTCRGELMFAIFYEPSTRTRISFCSGAIHLGMNVVWTENAAEFSSAVKGETLEDTIHVKCQYDPDVIVLRHNETGGAERAAKIVDRYGYDVSIINAGDGRGQHPTQALLDVYTIWKELGKLDGLTITVGGDLANGRTARSLVYLLTNYNNIKFVFFSPPELRMGKDILDHLREHEVSFIETSNKRKALEGSDVLYWTRVQTERGSTNRNLDISIGLPELEIIRKSAIILHPLPRVGEIKPEIDDDHRAAYYRQVRNGMLIRMQLLKQLCGK